MDTFFESLSDSLSNTSSLNVKGQDAHQNQSNTESSASSPDLTNLDNIALTPTQPSQLSSPLSKSVNIPIVSSTPYSHKSTKGFRPVDLASLIKSRRHSTPLMSTDSDWHRPELPTRIRPEGMTKMDTAYLTHVLRSKGLEVTTDSLHRLGMDLIPRYRALRMGKP